MKRSKLPKIDTRAPRLYDRILAAAAAVRRQREADSQPPTTRPLFAYCHPKKLTHP